MKFSKRNLYLLGFLTLFGFSAVGAVIIYYLIDRPVMSMFDHGLDVGYQLIAGAAYGATVSLIAWRIIVSDLMTEVRVFFVELFQEQEFKFMDLLFLSFCAGVGEEVLFRGAVQFYLGIWLTSLVFILLHGYINPKNWRLSIYGIFMVFLSAGLGYLYEYVGIISAMTAHFTIDLILLILIRGYKLPVSVPSINEVIPEPQPDTDEDQHEPPKQ
ncbi:MAG: CPBP family intramembrane metalloprotease [Bacteroidetes bacterium]|nr:CPBP family intramembrane metalloprotease [Bacteroidota bacterium]